MLIDSFRFPLHFTNANIMINFLLLLTKLLPDWLNTYPEQVHISLSDTETSMTITWASKYELYISKVEYSPVDFPTQPLTNFKYSVLGTWTAFPNSRSYSFFQRSLHSCKAKLTNLSPGQFYKYRVGSDFYGWSKTFTFKAQKNFTYSPQAKVIVYGDMGTGPEIEVTLDAIKEDIKDFEYDAIIHNGDFAYDLNSKNGAVGDEFMNSIEPIASKVPYMVSEGNHENGDRVDHYHYRFSMPGKSKNLFYSFNLGPVHFVSYSTELIFDGSEELQVQQKEFLQKDLAEFNRTLYPWLVVFGHRPLYCSTDKKFKSNGLGSTPILRNNRDCEYSAKKVRKTFEHFWFNGKVDLVITSHVHAYERLSAVHNKEKVPCEYEDFNTCVNSSAPIYIVTGVPGQKESYAPKTSTPLPFSVFQDDRWGYSRLNAFNSSHLLWEQVRSESKEVIDYLWIKKTKQF